MPRPLAHRAPVSRAGRGRSLQLEGKGSTLEPNVGSNVGLREWVAKTLEPQRQTTTCAGVKSSRTPEARPTRLQALSLLLQLLLLLQKQQLLQLSRLPAARQESTGSGLSEWSWLTGKPALLTGQPALLTGQPALLTGQLALLSGLLTLRLLLLLLQLLLPELLSPELLW